MAKKRMKNKTKKLITNLSIFAAVISAISFMLVLVIYPNDEIFMAISLTICFFFIVLMFYIIYKYGNVYDDALEFDYCDDYKINYNKKEFFDLINDNLKNNNFSKYKTYLIENKEYLTMYLKKEEKHFIFLGIINVDIIDTKTKNKIEKDIFEFGKTLDKEMDLKDIKIDTILIFCVNKLSIAFKRYIVRSDYWSGQSYNQMNVGINFKDNILYIIGTNFISDKSVYKKFKQMLFEIIEITDNEKVN